MTPSHPICVLGTGFGALATVRALRRRDRHVPITVIAQDPDIMAALDGWHWTPGLLPAPEVPAWRMSAFRDRFFAAFSGSCRVPAQSVQRADKA